MGSVEQRALSVLVPIGLEHFWTNQSVRFSRIPCYRHLNRAHTYTQIVHSNKVTVIISCFLLRRSVRGIRRENRTWGLLTVDMKRWQITAIHTELQWLFIQHTRFAVILPSFPSIKPQTLVAVCPQEEAAERWPRVNAAGRCQPARCLLPNLTLASSRLTDCAVTVFCLLSDTVLVLLPIKTDT